jgi:C4-type Zn-finger protein
MRQLTVTIPDEFYNSFIEFFKHVPEVKIDESQEEYNRSIEKMVIERVKNAKPEDYIPLEDALKELDKKWL